MTKPDDTAADMSNSTQTPSGKAAAPDTVVPNTPVRADTGPVSGADAKPAIDSALVGLPEGEPRKPAQKKAAEPGASGPATRIPAAGATVAKAPEPATPPARPVETAPETRVVEVRKAGFMPTFIGGVVAAGLGAGAAWWAIPHLPEAWRPVAPVQQDTGAQLDAARAAASEAARSEVETSRAAMVDAAAAAGAESGAEAAKEALNAALSAAPAGATDLSSVENAIAAQDQRIEGLDQAIAALNTPGQNASTAGVAGNVDPNGLAAVQSAQAQLRSQVEQLEGRVAELAERPVADGSALAEIENLRRQSAELQQSIAAAAQQAEESIASTRSEAASVQQQTTEIARRAQVAAAAAGLQAALETGGNLEGGISDLRAAGVEPPGTLSADVPSLPQIQAGFDQAARAGLAASLRADAPGGDALGAIGNFLRVQTGARSVEPKDGTDPDAILSRAGAAVRNGDIGTALAEISALPAPGQEAMAAWTADAQRWDAARAAVADLSSGSR